MTELTETSKRELEKFKTRRLDESSLILLDGLSKEAEKLARFILEQVPSGWDRDAALRYLRICLHLCKQQWLYPD